MTRPVGLLVATALALAACGGGGSAPDGNSQDPVALGRELFTTTCQACHGPHGGGIEGLGTNLIDSPFVRDLSDPDLVAYLEVGSPADDPGNTTGIAMPAKGGRPSLTTDDLSNLVAYLRTINS